MNTDIIISEYLLKKAIDKGFKCKNYEIITIYDIMKWLRDEKNIHIEIYTNASGYNYIISDTPKLGGSDRYWSDHEGPNDGGCWNLYEECVIAGIEYAINNFKII